MSFKYSLIVSQFYHSRHYFIVEMTEDFLKKAKAFALDALEYKRDPQPWRKPPEECLGDLTYCKGSEIRHRYNINDAGDIYFLQSDKLESLNYQINQFEETTKMELKFKRPKKLAASITKQIEERHDYEIIKNLVTKNFKLV